MMLHNRFHMDRRRLNLDLMDELFQDYDRFVLIHLFLTLSNIWRILHHTIYHGVMFWHLRE